MRRQPVRRNGFEAVSNSPRAADPPDGVARLLSSRFQRQENDMAINNTTSTSTSHMSGTGSTQQPSSSLAPGRRPVDSEEAKSWFEAMARAWGNALDQQASRVTELSQELSNGGDQPSTMTVLTAESLKMQFLANNASTANNSVGQALETLGKKE
jgi:hypothetical protein